MSDLGKQVAGRESTERGGIRSRQSPQAGKICTQVWKEGRFDFRKTWRKQPPPHRSERKEERWGGDFLKSKLKNERELFKHKKQKCKERQFSG